MLAAAEIFPARSLSGCGTRLRHKLGNGYVQRPGNTPEGHDLYVPMAIFEPGDVSLIIPLVRFAIPQLPSQFLLAEVCGKACAPDVFPNELLEIHPEAKKAECATLPCRVLHISFRIPPVARSIERQVGPSEDCYIVRKFDSLD